MVEEADGQKRLAPYERIAEIFHSVFWEAYQNRQYEKSYDYDLPMLIRGWRVNFAEAIQLIVLLEYRPLPFNTIEYEYEVEYQTEKPELASMEDVYEIAKVMHLGDVIDSRPFLFASAQDVISGEHQRQVEEWARAWAIDLADRHMAETHPDFETARRRMTDAYSKLFELERMLRLFVEQTLETHYGSNWWVEARISQPLRDDVSEKQADTRGWHLDDYDVSILKYVDFPGLRQIIASNEARFRHVTRRNTWFKQTLSALEPLRNRIGHMNVLSADDGHDFYRDAGRILAAIRPHVRLE